MSSTNSPLTAILRRQFDPSWAMLVELVDRWPDSLWAETRGGFPLWHQLMHALQDVRYWLQIRDEGHRPDEPTPELGTAAAAALSRREVACFAAETGALADRFFEALDDGRLLEPSPVNPALTRADAILHQIRHVTYHVGACDAILREEGVPSARWRGYGE